jgi:hypothetical protein
MLNMKRREFIALVGGGSAARAQGDARTSRATRDAGAAIQEVRKRRDAAFDLAGIAHPERGQLHPEHH